MLSVEIQVVLLLLPHASLLPSLLSLDSREADSQLLVSRVGGTIKRHQQR